MALVLSALYLGSMYGLYKYVTNKVKEYINEPIMEINNNDTLYEIVKNTVNNNTDNIILICDGSMSSMALLLILKDLYTDVNVAYLSHTTNDLVEDICERYGLTLYKTNIDLSDVLHSDHKVFYNMTKLSMIDKLCKDLNTNIVYEASTLNDITNNILHNMFSNNKLDESNYIKPFRNINNSIILAFVETYSIPYNTPNINIFDSFDFINTYYPDWREYLLDYTPNNNVLDIIDKSIYVGKYGLYYRYNIDNISYNMFGMVLNTIAKNNNINAPSTLFKNNIWYGKKIVDDNGWEGDSHIIIYMDNQLRDAIEKLRVYLENLYIDEFTFYFKVNLMDTSFKLEPIDMIEHNLDDLLNGIAYVSYNRANNKYIILY